MKENPFGGLFFQAFHSGAREYGWKSVTVLFLHRKDKAVLIHILLRQLVSSMSFFLIQGDVVFLYVEKKKTELQTSCRKMAVGKGEGLWIDSEDDVYPGIVFLHNPDMLF